MSQEPSAPGGGPEQSQPPQPDAKVPAAFPTSPDEPAGPALPTGVDAGSTRALSWLLTASPFLDLHQKAGGDHPKRGALCFLFDFLLRLLVVVLLLAIVTTVAWKTLAPLPPLWQVAPQVSSN